MANTRVYCHHIRCPDCGSNRMRKDGFSKRWVFQWPAGLPLSGGNGHYSASAHIKNTIQQATILHGVPCETDRPIRDFLHRLDGVPPFPNNCSPVQAMAHYEKWLDGRLAHHLASFSAAESLKTFGTS